MNDEPWYMKRGRRYGFGYGAYLLILPFAVAAGFGWNYLFRHMIEHHEWVYQIVYWLSWIPWGHLLVPLVVIGVTVAPCLYLCHLIHKHTDFGKGESGERSWPIPCRP